MELYLGLVMIMSFISFILYKIDKKRAIKNKYRIKEKTLLLSSLLFGSIGGLCGMYLLRHKTRHWYFVVVNYLSSVLHVLIAIYIYKEKGFMYI